jgi:hypothetical protein
MRETLNSGNSSMTRLGIDAPGSSLVQSTLRAGA